jgi:hypothetical protein
MADTEIAATTTTDSTSLTGASSAGTSLASESTAATNVRSAVEEKPLAQQSKEENKAALIAKLAAKSTDAAPAATDAPTAETTTEEKPAEEVAAPVAAAAPSEEDRAAAALLKLAQEGRAIAKKERELRQQASKLKTERESLQSTLQTERTANQARLEAQARLETARLGGDELAILRAAGLTEEQLRGPFILNALQKLSDQEAATPQAPAAVKPPPTKEEILAAVLEQQRLDRESATKAAQEADAKAREENRNAFFGDVVKEFKGGKYPLVAAVRPLQAELDQHVQDHYRKTGERLNPAQLLGAFEERYRAAGITVASKAPTRTPAKAPPAATTRTIGSRANEDGGSAATAAPVSGRSMDEVRAEGKRKALAAIEERRAQRAMR